MEKLRFRLKTGFLAKHTAAESKNVYFFRTLTGKVREPHPAAFDDVNMRNILLLIVKNIFLFYVDQILLIRKRSPLLQIAIDPRRKIFIRHHNDGAPFRSP